jgi:hypothetical protein
MQKHFHRGWVVSKCSAILLLCLLSFTVSAQIFVTDIPNNSTSIEYVGEWAHMPQGGSFPKNKDAYVKYSFTGLQIQVFTERASDHGQYIVTFDGYVVDTVNVQNDNFIKNFATWYKKYLHYPAKHTIKLQALDNRPFVLDKFRTMTDDAVFKQPYFWADSMIYETVFDTVTTQVLDSIPVPYPVPFDSAVIKITYDTLTTQVIDSIPFPYGVPFDSAVVVIVYDSSLVCQDTLPPMYGDIHLQIQPGQIQGEIYWLLYIIGAVCLGVLIIGIVQITKKDNV